MKFAHRPMMFPERHHLTLPKAFKNRLLKNVRCVIDCTEFFSQSSSDYKQKGNMFSNYKSHATVKALIGVSPAGAAMFVSDVYEGSISDRKIVEDSKFADNLLPGDTILADRGFLIEDICREKGATLVIPPFLKRGQTSFTLEETQQTKLIARARIHVERFNARIKVFKILQGFIPMTLMPLMSQILFVICCLANFQEPLVKD